MIRAYTHMLPRLQAEESLARAEQVAVGMGNRKREYNRETVARWSRQAAIERPPKQRPNPAALAAMGIQVVMEPAPTK